MHNPPRILIVDDNETNRDILVTRLSTQDYELSQAADGEEALVAARSLLPDLILLDVMMPKIDGITLLPMLRRITEAPVVMLSAKGELEDKVEGLGHGADDYLSKPFEISELIAHIEAKLRRPHIEHPETLHYDGLNVDLTTHEVSRDGRRLDLSPLEYKLLTTLLRRPKRVFTREDLIELVWGDESDVTDAAVERYISYLRTKVDEGFEKHLIQTVRGAGYTLRDELSS